MSSNSVGEVLVICALARSMIKTYGYPITLCVRPEHAKMVEILYPERFIAIVPMDQALMRSFSESGFVSDDRFDIDFPIHLSPSHHQGGLLWNLHNLLFKRGGASGLNVTDVFRCLLHLDWDAPIEKPCIDFFKSENANVAKLGVDVVKRNHVLLQPGNNTNKPLPASFWHSIEDKYIAEECSTFANLKGAMLIDKNIQFRSSQQIDLDIMDALYLAYHSKTVVSVMNGLINAAILLDYFDHEAPIIHGINTDKYCEHYHLLRDNWEAAFSDFQGPPSTWLGGNETISDTSKFCEWRIATTLTSDDYEVAASAIYKNDQASTFYVSSYLDNNRFNFPESYSYESLNSIRADK